MTLSISRRPRVDDTSLLGVVNPVIRQIFASRGVTDPDALEKSASALQHYRDLNGIDSAVRLLANALQHQQKIVVIGDFDADGATSVALCMLSLGALGSKHHDYLVPNRFDFGYGLSPEIVELAHQQGAQVLMTVDNGIACFAGVERAKALGLKVVVTDHHLPADSLPPADAIVNPNQPNCQFASKNLAGVGVAFYLMLALRAHLNSLDWFTKSGVAEPNLANWLDIVALGTVADVVPLDANNRVLVHQGLQRIRSGRCRPGITALLDVAGRNPAKIVASDLGFALGPRLNAAGRLDDMALGIECLLAADHGRARQMAVQLDSLNRERREIEASMQQDALAALQSLALDEKQVPYGITLFRDDFHQGVIGILAGRIKDKFHRPTIAFAVQDDETLKGSARSIPGLHIRDLLEELNSRHPGLILKFGGHAMAAGLSIERQHLESFQSRFAELAETNLAGKPLGGEILSDGELDKDTLTLDFAEALRQAGPWGQSFPEPVFDGHFTLLDQRLVGQKHLKMMVQHPSGVTLDAIAFNVDTHVWPNPAVKSVQLAYKLDINEFRGRVSLQLMVEGLAAA